MPILDCSVKNCIHNMEARCQLEQIKVEGRNATDSGSTACGSFQLRRDSDSYTNSAHLPNPENDVKCAAENCCFNEDCKCHADHIDISGNGACVCGETLCQSFRCDCK